MPEEGLDPSPRSNLLTDDEIIRVATMFVKNGVKKIRLTGGEPTIRKNIMELVGKSSVTLVGSWPNTTCLLRPVIRTTVPRVAVNRDN
jgi:molybdenum cofactor biosynthesis enzyme MoaA